MIHIEEMVRPWKILVNRRLRGHSVHVLLAVVFSLKVRPTSVGTAARPRQVLPDPTRPWLRVQPNETRRIQLKLWSHPTVGVAM